jgi:DNA-binding SARP family transcriptional activator
MDIVEASNGLLSLTPLVSVDLQDARARAHRLLDRSTPCGPGDLTCRPFTEDLLPGWYDDWVLLERERFRQLRLHALEAVCERLTALGRFGEAIEAGLAAVAGEPLRESAHRSLIRAYIAEGNQAEAARQYRFYAALLRDELQIDASPMMRELVRSLPAG